MPCRNCSMSTTKRAISLITHYIDLIGHNCQEEYVTVNQYTKVICIAEKYALYSYLTIEKHAKS